MAFGGKITRRNRDSRRRSSYKSTRRYKHRARARDHSKMKKYRWSANAPDTHQRTVMLRRCGSKCFLGPHKSFPICRKNTCKRNKAGVHAAYIRAREYQSHSKRKGQYKKEAQYRAIANKAKRMLRGTSFYPKDAKRI